MLNGIPTGTRKERATEYTQKELGGNLNTSHKLNTEDDRNAGNEGQNVIGHTPHKGHKTEGSPSLPAFTFRVNA